MSDYSIFVLGESQLSISGGGLLDGVTQGNGSHLVGLTITLNAPAWSEVQISDAGGDGNFQDNDGNQRLNGSHVIDGVTYASGTQVEAEYGITLTDGVSTWQAIGFNLNNSSPSYGTIEGLAFIGGPGGFPPVGVALTVLSAQEGPNYASGAYATPICFDRGTWIDTDKGPRRIETLKPGDRVLTLDSGPQPIRWIGSRQVIGAGRFAPVEIAAGVLGASMCLRVSQQHRLLLTGPRAELLFGEAEVFVSTIHLVDGRNVRLVQNVAAEYFHLLLDRHEIIRANAVESESLYHQVDDKTGISEFFPELNDFAPISGSLARPCLRRHEAALLVAEGRMIEPRAALRHIA